MDGLYEQIRIGVHQVWRRRWLALAIAWGLCLLGWLAVALIPNEYESRARVFAQMQSILPQQMGITAAERQNDGPGGETTTAPPHADTPTPRTAVRRSAGG